MNNNNYGQSLYQFKIIINFIKMKVKFPCKMTIEYASNIQSNQLSSNQQSKYIFNQQIILKDQPMNKSSAGFFQLIVNIITEKGLKYIAGIIRLHHNQLVHSQGERIVVALIKCLDAEAYAELKVQKVSAKQVQKKVTLPTSNNKQPLKNYETVNFYSPNNNNSNNQMKSILQGNTFGTRSQVEFPTSKLKDWQQNKSKEENYQARSYYKKFTKPSPPKTRRKLDDVRNPSPIRSNYMNMMKNIRQNQRQREDSESKTVRERMMEAEVYKQNYQKLKQKFRKQNQNYKTELNKRVKLQNNQNSFKLQIVRLRLKCEQLQKITIDKSNRLKDLQTEYSYLQQKDSDINYYKQELMNLKNSVSMLEDTIITLNNDNQQMKQLLRQKDSQYKVRMTELQSQYQKTKTLLQNKENQYDKEIRQVRQKNTQLQYDYQLKCEQYQKQKKQLYEYEKQSQNKLFQFDTLIQQERNNFRQKLQEMTKRIQSLTKDNKKLEQEKASLYSQLERMKALIMKSEYEFKLQIQEYNATKNQIEEMKNIREKYTEASRQIKSLKEQKVSLEYKFQQLLKGKQTNLQQLSAQYKRQIDNLKKLISQNLQKQTNLLHQKQELQSAKQSISNNLQKSKRSHQSLLKDFIQLKSVQKSLKKNISQKQQTIEAFQQELKRNKQKFITFNQFHKAQADRFKTQINVLRLKCEQQQISISQLSQKNLELSHQLQKQRLSLQFSQQKIEKNINSSKQKYKSYQAILEQHQNVINLMNHSINQYKIKENQLFNTLNSLENVNTSLKIQQQKLNKELKLISQKYCNLQSVYKQKSSENSQLVNKLTISQKEQESLTFSLTKSKDQLNMIKNQYQKLMKMHQLAISQNQTNKQLINSNKVDILSKDTQNQEFLQLVKIKEQQHKKTSLKLENTTKQFSKFKQNLMKSLMDSSKQFNQLSQQTYAMLNSLGNFGASLENDWQSKKNTRNDNSQSFGTYMKGLKNQSRSQNSSDGVQLFNDIQKHTHQLLDTFSTFSKENYSTITKLLQKSKNQQKQIEHLNKMITQKQKESKRSQYQNFQNHQQMQSSLRGQINQKNAEIMKQNRYISDLSEQLQEKQQILSQIQSQNDEMQFTLSSNKMGYDATLNQLDKKNFHLKNTLIQLQDKVQFQNNLVLSLEQKCYSYQKDYDNLNQLFIKERETSHLHALQIKQQQVYIQKLQNEVSNLKSKILQFNSKLLEHDLLYSSEKQIKLKLQQTLSEEQSKKRELKDFSANLIKEKQALINKELRQNQKITQLQNSLLQVQHYKEMLLEDQKALKLQIQQFKGQIKKLNNLKTQEQKLKTEQITKNLNFATKLKQKQKQLLQQAQKQKILQQRLKSFQQNSKKSLQQLNQELAYTASQKHSIIQDLSKKIQNLTQQNQNHQQTIAGLKSQIIDLQEYLFIQKQKCRNSEQAVINKQNQLNEMRYKIDQLDHQLQEVVNQLNQKQETAYELSANLYQLQTQLKQSQIIKQEELQQINSQWLMKYQDLYTQLQQRIQISDKQKLYLKQKYQEKQEELSKKAKQFQKFLNQEEGSKKFLQDKMKKIQEDKLSLLTLKNQELQKVSTQLKQNFQSFKQKEGQNRKICNQLEIARNQIVKLDTKISEYDQKIKNINKSYQTEIETMKKKENQYKNFKQVISNNQWNTQRQARRLFQVHIKTLLQNGDDIRSTNKLMTLVKSLQQNIIGVISQNSSQQNSQKN